ncbi:hypothetical protein OIO90_003725 [Microbotryomycetes sp. JL221]|nr:hypothetical protein OIO90_003725 [Microbotryomycetes sp. JL221]
MSTRGNQFTQFAETTFSASGASGLYDRARPDYPQPAVDKLFSLLPKQGAIVELGSGTGLFSRMLLRDGRDGRLAKLHCVEPSKGMRQGFQDKLDTANDIDRSIKVDVVDGLFDQIPVEDKSADMVVAAQAFHWVGHDGRSAISEIARVLKPGGHAIFIWNLEDRSVGWVAKLRDLFEQYEGGTPQYRHGYWKTIYDTAEYNDNFDKHEVHTFKRGLPVTEDLAIDRVLSKSYITALDDDKKAKLTEQMRQVLRDAEDKVIVDEKAGTFEYPYTTDMFVMKRR